MHCVTTRAYLRVLFEIPSLICQSGVTSSPQTLLRIVTHTLQRRLIRFRSWISSRENWKSSKHVVAREWRNVKEKERDWEQAKKKTSREIVDKERERELGEMEREKKARMKEKPREILFPRLGAIAFDFTERGNSRGRIYCARGVKSCILPQYIRFNMRERYGRPFVVPHTGFRYRISANFNRTSTD